MSEHPSVTLRRLAPDAVQVQVILGSLLGDARLVGGAGARRLRIVHRADRAPYILWKRERLGPLSIEPPRLRDDGLLELRTLAHPLFDDLAPLFPDDPTHPGAPQARRSEAIGLLTPLGLAVWLADLGRLELRPEAFLPAQREVTLAAVRMRAAA